MKYLDKISKKSLSIGVRSEFIYLELSTPDVLFHQYNYKKQSEYIKFKKDYYHNQYKVENMSYIDQIISNFNA